MLTDMKSKALQVVACACVLFSSVGCQLPWFSADDTHQEINVDLFSRPEDKRRSIDCIRELESRGYTIDAPGLTQALKSSELSDRTFAAFLLGYNKQTSAQEALETALKDGSARVRVEAALALARLGKPGKATPVLLAELNGKFFEDAPLRAARALALLGDPVGYDRVIEALHSPLPSNRMEAIAVLPVFLPYAGQSVKGQMVDPVTALVEAVTDPEPILRRDALTALALTRDDRATPVLQAALHDPDEEVRQLAQWLLELSPQDLQELELQTEP